MIRQKGICVPLAGLLTEETGAGKPPTRLRLAAHLLTLSSTEVPPKDLGRSALVFSPHPDDECLGCGGTIVKKKQAGGAVKIVHMTDGRRSHPTSLISEHELIATRHGEALNAAAVLGAEDVYFLDFRDQALSVSTAPAIERVVEILRREQPEEVFLPHRREPMRYAADHVATRNIILAALRSYPRRVMVWEYLVWSWLHWPWVGFKKGCLERRFVAQNSLNLLFGWRALLEVRDSVNISDVLGKKIIALGQYRSQMTELVPNAAWTTLGKVCGGQFLDVFCLGREFFRRSAYKDHA